MTTTQPVMTRLVSGKLLRCGYTTGTCAAAAAKAATLMVITGELVQTVSIDTPEGIRLVLDTVDAMVNGDHASCAVRKDAGDDPDATNGALIYAAVTHSAQGVTIDGGKGIGRVTQPGLDQPVGAAAINSVPRTMIDQAVREVAEEEGVLGGWSVIISCPTGEQIAAKTFNPRLGIVGGISILGTTGIVEPMSNAALVETTAREISILAARGCADLLIVIGNYGEAYARDTLGLSRDALTEDNPHPRYGMVKSSNFIGDAIDAAVEHNFTRLLIVGHIGKMVKLGIGMLNTHSSQGDGRMETLVACALAAGAGSELLRRLLCCVSTDAALTLLQQRGLFTRTMAELTKRITATLTRRVPDSVQIEWICFMTQECGYTQIASSGHAKDLVERWNQ